MLFMNVAFHTPRATSPSVLVLTADAPGAAAASLKSNASTACVKSALESRLLVAPAKATNDVTSWGLGRHKPVGATRRWVGTTLTRLGLNERTATV
jgi:hypothetical protein